MTLEQIKNRRKTGIVLEGDNLKMSMEVYACLHWNQSKLQAVASMLQLMELT